MKGEYAMPRSEASKKQQYEYNKEYRKNKIVYRSLNFNIDKPDDQKMLDWIDSQPEGTSPYLKRLVQEDMSRAAAEEEKAER